MTSKTSITWFIARNHEGEFSCGQTNDGDTYWTENLVDARFHETIGPVKAAVTKWVKRHPDVPIPEILEWTIDIATAKVIDVAGETQKRIDRARKKKEADERRDVKEALEQLMRDEVRIAEKRMELLRKI
jgi:hypothetical protein